jgi:hypothetical protein
MSRKNREQSGRQALAARMSAQFDLALSEAAEAIESLGSAWDDIGPDGDEDDDLGDLLPLEFQLADLERAVDTILEERDRFLYGYLPAAEEAAGESLPRSSSLPGRRS